MEGRHDERGGKERSAIARLGSVMVCRGCTRPQSAADEQLGNTRRRQRTFALSLTPTWRLNRSSALADSLSMSRGRGKYKHRSLKVERRKRARLGVDGLFRRKKDVSKLACRVARRRATHVDLLLEAFDDLFPLQLLRRAVQLRVEVSACAQRIPCEAQGKRARPPHGCRTEGRDSRQETILGGPLLIGENDSL